MCNKVRAGEQRIVRIKEGDPRGRHVVIVDDLVQSGSTLIECQVKNLYQLLRIAIVSLIPGENLNL